MPEYQNEVFDINTAVHIVCDEIRVNDYGFVSAVTDTDDALNGRTFTVETDEMNVGEKTFEAFLSRITDAAQVIKDEQAIYRRAEAFSSNGLLHTGKLEGVIDVLRNQLASITSNWYTDSNGNMIFESLDGESAMMLCGSGFMCADGKTESGAWNWRTFGTGKGFTADLITAGVLRAGVITILGSDQFLWNGENIYVIDPTNENRQIRIGKYDGEHLGIAYTQNGGETWQTAIGFDGIHLSVSDNNRLDEMEQAIANNSTAITQTSEKIMAEVDKKADDTEIRSLITQTAESLTSKINQKIGEEEVSSMIQQATNDVMIEVNKKTGEEAVQSMIQASENKILLEVSKKVGEDEAKSLIRQSEDKILLEVENKVGEDEVLSMIQQSSEEILIEVRKPASAVDTGNGIRINENGVDISGVEVDISAGGGSEYIRMTEGGIETTRIKSPTVSPRYAGNALLTVNPNATAEQMTEWGIYRSLSDALYQLEGKQIEGKIQINCVDGSVLYEDITLSGVCGGEIEINAPECTLYGTIAIIDCSSRIQVNSLSIVTMTECALRAEGCTYIGLWRCTISSSSSEAVHISEGTRLYAVECTLLSSAGKAAYVTMASFGVFIDCIGTGALVTQFASLAAMGSVPDGGCENWGGSLINTEGVVPTGANGQPVAPEIITAIYTMTHSDSWRGGWNWVEDNDIRQGYVSSGQVYGCVWFDNDLIRSQLKGRPINQASIRLSAMTGVGRGVAVSVELHGTVIEYETRNSASNPEVTTSYGIIGSFEPGEVITVTIPIQAVDDLVNGTINGFMLYSSDTQLYKEKSYSRNYARFAGETSADESNVPMLTVVTEGASASAAICGQILCGETICGEE